MSAKPAAAQYDAYKDDIENGEPIGGHSTIGRYAMKVAGLIVAQDVGPGNFNFGEALHLLKEYNASHPKSDPLDLKEYNGNYVGFYNDLRSTNSDATIKLAVLKVHDVTQQLSRDPVLGRPFASLQSVARDAAIDAGYRTSIPGLRRVYEQSRRIYTPRANTYDYFYSPSSPYNYAHYKPLAKS